MHPSPQAMTRALSRVIRDRWGADAAMEEMSLTVHEALP
jgi:hypothetical protein